MANPAHLGEWLRLMSAQAADPAFLRRPAAVRARQALEAFAKAAILAKLADITLTPIRVTDDGIVRAVRALDSVEYGFNRRDRTFYGGLREEDGDWLDVPATRMSWRMPSPPVRRAWTSSAWPSGKDGERYMGFTLGQATSPFMDVALLIEPVAAAAYEEATRPPPPEPTSQPTATDTTPTSTTTTSGTSAATAATTSTSGSALPTHFWASAELDPVSASLKFAKIMNELVELFSAKHGTNVVIKVDIDATDSRGFDETTVRAAKENSGVLGISSVDFD